MGVNQETVVPSYAFFFRIQTPIKWMLSRVTEVTVNSQIDLIPETDLKLNKPSSLSIEWIRNSLWPEQYGLYFTDISKCIFLSEKGCVLIEISLNFIPNGPIDKVSRLVQEFTWRNHNVIITWKRRRDVVLT